MRSLGPLERLAAGAIGMPGRRRFFLQIDADGGSYWFLFEKQQAVVLAERVTSVLREAGYEVGTARASDLDDFEPGSIEFRIGEMTLGLIPDSTSVLITLYPADEDDGEPVIVEATFAQLDGMAQAALSAVVAGRPLCPRCSLAMDSEGHVCPASNGDLRRHQP